MILVPETLDRSQITTCDPLPHSLLPQKNAVYDRSEYSFAILEAFSIAAISPKLSGISSNFDKLDEISIYLFNNSDISTLFQISEFDKD